MDTPACTNPPRTALPPSQTTPTSLCFYSSLLDLFTVPLQPTLESTSESGENRATPNPHDPHLAQVAWCGFRVSSPHCETVAGAGANGFGFTEEQSRIARRSFAEWVLVAGSVRGERREEGRGEDLVKMAANNGGSFKSVPAREDNIKVVVRSRPLNSAEKAAKTPSLVSCDRERREVSVAMTVGSKRSSKKYTYDVVFGPYATQNDVYQAAIGPIVDEVLQGYNCTVFAYGQTGTGKTHTMEGVLDDPELQGMIPRAVSTIFDSLNTMEETEFTVKVSFLELYNEELQDLLSVTDEKKLRILDDKSRMGTGVACHNLEEVMVKSTDEILGVMKKAMAKRQVGETKLNKASSRSHCIFSMTVHIRETTPEGEDLLKVGKLNLVDLAGSECIGRSGAQNQRAREAGNINKSLLTLGRVISALVEKTPHIPYRDSKLTRLLQESLGGRAKTCIIATVAPSVQCLDETLSTLDYASRAKTIKNKPEANQRMTKRTLIKEYAEDLERIRQELASARAKDGVYLTEDRYNEMTMEIESQKNQIEELEDAMEQRQKELSELQDLFDATSEKLEETEAELGTTKTKLQQTEVELDETKDELGRQIVLVEETKVLVKAHEVTEGKLHVNTSDLHTTIDEAEGDVTQLHDKVGRKTQIEEANAQVSKNFERNTVDALAEISKKSSTFCGDQITHHEGLQESLAAMKERHQDQTSDILAAIAKLDQDAAKHFEIVSKEIAPKHAQEAKAQWEKGNSMVLDQDARTHAALEDTMKATSTPLKKILEEILSEQQAELEAHSQHIETKLAESKMDVASFAEKQAKALSELSSKVASDAEESRRVLENQGKKINSFVQAERQRIEFATDALVEQFTSMLVAFKTEAQTNFSNILAETQDACKKSVEDMVHMELQTKSSVQQAMTITKEWCSETASSIDALQAKAKDSISICDALNASTRSEVETSVQAISDHIDTLRNLSSDGAEAFNQHHKVALEALDDQVEVIETSVKDFKGTLAVNQGATNSLINEQESATSCWAASCDAKIKQNKDNVISTCEGLSSAASALVTKTQTYVQEELVIDQPTGLTPRRKGYHFDRLVPSTSPHADIIERYRLAKPTGEDLPDLQGYHSLEKERGEEEEKTEETLHLNENEGAPEEESLENDDREEEEKNERANSPASLDTEEEEDEEGGQKPMRKSLGEISNIVSPVRQGALEKKAIPGVDMAPPPTPPSQLTEEGVLAMKVAQLRKQLSSMGLSQLGNKATLQSRLLATIEG